MLSLVAVSRGRPSRRGIMGSDSHFGKAAPRRVFVGERGEGWACRRR